MASTDNSLVIVALPAEDDYVRQISSEKEPHLTLLYLGQNNFDADQIAKISDYIEYAASLTRTFGLSVSSRGVLGPKDADVLFFSRDWCEQVLNFRSQLFQNDLIQQAYYSTDQFEQWQPHLTLGYPATPAKPDKNDYSGISYVRFDRIALWTSDSSGPTFPLMKDEAMAVASPLMMSDVGAYLAHHGVKGMKWGVRKADNSSSDAKAADAARAKINSGGTRSLSNQELQGLINRMNLERQYSSMTTNNHTLIDRGLIKAQKVLKVGGTIEQARVFMKTPTGRAVTRGLKGAFAAANVAASFYTGGASAAASTGGAIVVRSAANHFTNVGN